MKNGFNFWTAQVDNGDLDNTTDPITIDVDVAPPGGATAPFYVSIDGDGTGEVAICTAFTGPSLTLDRPNAVAHAGSPEITCSPVWEYFDDVVTEFAPLASPALTGAPTAPTASPLDSSTQVATTEYVDDAVAAGGGGGGGNVQVVESGDGAYASGTTTIPIDDSKPQQTEGDERYAVTITPTNAASILCVDTLLIYASSVNDNVTVAIFRDSGADAIGAGFRHVPTSEANIIDQISASAKVTAGSTSPTTFKVRLGGSEAGTRSVNGAGGSRYFGGAFRSFIRVTEIAP